MEEVRAAIRTLRAASFHAGWIDLDDPAELDSLARGWDINPDILRAAGRVAGWSVPALHAVYRDEQLAGENSTPSVDAHREVSLCQRPDPHV